MPIETEREAILERFTCAHVRLTRAPLAGGQLDGPSGFGWAPSCVHPRMHDLFDGAVSFCERCPCYMRRQS